MLRYGLYARKSKEDKSGVIKSIEDQKHIWEELAGQQNLSIDRTYEENKTAKIPGVRPIYDQLVRDLQAGVIDGVLVWHVNRLARNMQEAGALAQMLIDGKIKELRTPHWTYRPGDNILPLLLEQGTATQYSLDLSEAVTRGTNSMVEAGGWPHMAKLGYLNARDPVNPKKGIIVIDPERYALTRRGFDLMLTGTKSVREVIKTMNAWGLQTRPTPRRPGQPLSNALGYDIFSSPFYAGFTKHNGLVRKGSHQPMVTIAEFNRIQEITQTSQRTHARNMDFAFTGIIRCGNCGKYVTAEKHTKAKSGVTYVYYHCSDPYNTCTKKGISERDLEQEIVRMLQSITIDPELSRICKDNIDRWLNAQDQDSANAVHELQTRLKAIEQERKNLLTMMVRGVMSDETMYKQTEQELVSEHNKVSLEIKRTQDLDTHMRGQAAGGLAYAEAAFQAFSVAPPALKKEITTALGMKYELKGRELTIDIDPLLTELVGFAEQIKAKLEPASVGNQSHYQASSTTLNSFGRGAQALLEPSKSLIDALKASLFRCPVFDWVPCR